MQFDNKPETKVKLTLLILWTIRTSLVNPQRFQCNILSNINPILAVSFDYNSSPTVPICPIFELVICTYRSSKWSQDYFYSRKNYLYFSQEIGSMRKSILQQILYWNWCKRPFLYDIRIFWDFLTASVRFR